jgi:agmatinase
MTDKKSFFNLDHSFSEYETSTIAILRAPYEKTTSYIRGTFKGPDAIMDASLQVELYDIETDSEPYKLGIYTSEALEFDEMAHPENSLKIIENEVARLLNDEKFPVIIGGEHTISLATFRAFHKKFNGVTCVSLDAHSDLRDTYRGSEYSHACVMRRISELKKPILLGIRSMDITEMEFAMDNGLTVQFAHQIVQKPEIIKNLNDNIGEKVYLSIDMDVFDPSYVPGVGTPEPGGLDWFQILDIIKYVNSCSKIVGVDIVELLPIKDHIRSEFLAAKLIYKILAYIFNSKSIF